MQNRPQHEPVKAHHDRSQWKAKLKAACQENARSRRIQTSVSIRYALLWAFIVVMLLTTTTIKGKACNLAPIRCWLQLFFARSSLVFQYETNLLANLAYSRFYRLFQMLLHLVVRRRAFPSCCSLVSLFFAEKEYNDLLKDIDAALCDPQLELEMFYKLQAEEEAWLDSDIQAYEESQGAQEDLQPMTDN